MRRIAVHPRWGWQSIVEAQGFRFHTSPNGKYWDESTAYVLTPKDVAIIESATEELQRLCVFAARHIIDRQRFGWMKIPEAIWPLIVDSWDGKGLGIYGRFDLAYNGEEPPKLLEYNAQTATSLLESSLIQRTWQSAVRPDNRQCNSLRAKLIARWRECLPLLGDHLYVSCVDDAEDRATVECLGELAKEAGFHCEYIDIQNIGWLDGQFIDKHGTEINSIYVLYPWEWLIAEQPHKIARAKGTTWLEPTWKILWQSKALLAVLWHLFPGHPNLLECHLEGPGMMTSFVTKPIFSREGANITVASPTITARTNGKYGREGVVYQHFAKLARFADKFAVIGSWYVMGQGPAGISVRESDGPITDKTARFVPHFIDC